MTPATGDHSPEHKRALAATAQAALVERYGPSAAPALAYRELSLPPPPCLPPQPRRRDHRRQRADLIAVAQRRCHWCRRLGTEALDSDGRPWHLDHRVPLSLGGEDHRRNLVLACARCNLTRPGGRGRASPTTLPAEAPAGSAAASDAELDELAEWRRRALVAEALAAERERTIRALELAVRMSNRLGSAPWSAR